MTLLPGFRVAVAPSFHLAGDWPERMSLGAGLEQTATGLVARPPWRLLSEDELAVLTPNPSMPCEELCNCLCLFVVPVHLRSRFWDLLAQSQEHGEVPSDGFGDFVADVAGFLAFKRMRLPAGAISELVLNRPGPTAPLVASSLWGLINLGEDAASLVFLNVPVHDIPGPDYPPLRFQLAPGEGIQVPAGMLLGSVGPEREHSDVLLRIRLAGDSAPLVH